MCPALRVKEYLYLIKRKRHKSETCFNLAIIGCGTHVKIGQQLPKCIEEPKMILVKPFLTFVDRYALTTCCDASHSIRHLDLNSDCFNALDYVHAVFFCMLSLSRVTWFITILY